MERSLKQEDVLENRHRVLTWQSSSLAPRARWVSLLKASRPWLRLARSLNCRSHFEIGTSFTHKSCYGSVSGCWTCCQRSARDPEYATWATYPYVSRPMELWAFDIDLDRIECIELLDDRSTSFLCKITTLAYMLKWWKRSIQLALSITHIPRKTPCFLKFKAMILVSNLLQRQSNALRRSTKVLVSGSQVQTKKRRICGKIANMHLLRVWERFLELAPGLQMFGKDAFILKMSCSIIEACLFLVFLS